MARVTPRNGPFSPTAPQTLLRTLPNLAGGFRRRGRGLKASRSSHRPCQGRRRAPIAAERLRCRVTPRRSAHRTPPLFLPRRRRCRSSDGTAHGRAADSVAACDSGQRRHVRQRTASPRAIAPRFRRDLAYNSVVRGRGPTSGDARRRYLDALQPARGSARGRFTAVGGHFAWPRRVVTSACVFETARARRYVSPHCHWTLHSWRGGRGCFLISVITVYLFSDSLMCANTFL